MERDEMIETTLGDLIAALTEETAQYFSDDYQTRNVVAFALMDLLHSSSATSRVRLTSH